MEYQIKGQTVPVVEFTLKSTRIKSLTGEVKIIANREINSVINYSTNIINLYFIKNNKYL